MPVCRASLRTVSRLQYPYYWYLFFSLQIRESLYIGTYGNIIILYHTPSKMPTSNSTLWLKLPPWLTKWKYCFGGQFRIIIIIQKSVYVLRSSGVMYLQLCVNALNHGTLNNNSGFIGFTITSSIVLPFLFFSRNFLIMLTLN